MISSAWTFHYVGTIEASGIGDRDIVIPMQAAGDSTGGGLAGRAPSLRLTEGFFTLIATSPVNAAVKWFNFYLGDVLTIGAKAGDEIEAVRDDNGSLGVALRRDGGLRAAVGAITSLSLGPDITVRAGAGAASVRIGGVQCSLRERHSSTVGVYDFYLESAPQPGIDTPSPCLSLALAADQLLVNAARRSAVLLTHQAFDRLRGERPDGSFIKD